MYSTYTFRPIIGFVWNRCLQLTEIQQLLAETSQTAMTTTWRISAVCALYRESRNFPFQQLFELQLCPHNCHQLVRHCQIVLNGRFGELQNCYHICNERPLPAFSYQTMAMAHWSPPKPTTCFPRYLDSKIKHEDIVGSPSGGLYVLCRRAFAHHLLSTLLRHKRSTERSCGRIARGGPANSSKRSSF